MQACSRWLCRPLCPSGASFQYANARFDGFGAGGGLTWRHAASKIKGRKHLYQQAARPDMLKQ